MVNNIQAIVLAAGKSRGSSTNITKLAHKICGQEMVVYPLSLLQELTIPTTVVVGYQKERIQKLCSRFEHITFAYQSEQRGTGHAVACAKDFLTADTLLIMNGDTPLITKDIIENLIASHKKNAATLSFIVAHNADPSGSSYGRFVHDNDGMRIIAGDAFDGDYHEHCLIDAGIYLVQKEFLLSALPLLKPCPTNDELCLSELVSYAYQQKATIATTHAPFDRIRSIDTLQDLWAAEHIKRSDLIRMWMSKGVRFSMPQTVHLDLAVTIGQDTTIGAGVHLFGTTSVGRNCTVREYCTLENATLEDNATVMPHSFVAQTTVAAQSSVGPFAHLHKQASTASGYFTARNSFIGAIKTNDSSSMTEGL